MHRHFKYRGGCSVPWYREVFSTVGDIMSNVGVIVSTMGDTQYHGGYHEYSGVFSTLGE